MSPVELAVTAAAVLVAVLAAAVTGVLTRRVNAWTRPLFGLQ